MLDFLAPYFPGPLRPFADRLSVAAPDARAGQPWATEALARMSRTTGCADLRPLAAAWFRDYTKAVLPGALVAAAVHRRRLPFDRAVLQVAEDGWLGQLALPDDGVPAPAGASLPAILSPLLDHMRHVVAALGTAGRVSPRLLWCTGGVAASGIARQLAVHPALKAGVRDDVMTWIRRAESADGFPNPLYGAFRPGAEPGIPGVAPVRRICCLNYRLPAEGHCGTCPRVAVSPGDLATGATATTS
ncbi:siderophore-iron reductase FhuF [Cupriavidus agavae]|uniref:Ferric iron reductase protein FhuF n=1 Tax=Cupriavidus agavae TaxID=1001822 RepID=A0A4Q7S199_9BURK|nr:siderophore-iron reductase FhuF [Cupriavidus agavae]RZT39140.1 ferric iron reductase protein FhuF [Cupriavidus agavae]